MSFLPLLLTLLLVLVGAEATVTRSCQQEAPGVVIRERYRGNNTSACSMLDCILTHCTRGRHCVVAFHQPTGRCMTVAAALQGLVPFLANSGILFIHSREPEWRLMVSEGLRIRTDGPAALWLMDRDFQGSNLGTKGSRLDMQVTDMKWGSVGPRGVASGRRYSRFEGAAGGTVQVLQKGSFLLNYTNPFTLSLWVKTDDVRSSMALIEGRMENGQFKCHFWLHNDTLQRQLFVNLGSSQGYFHLFSHVSSDDRLSWRHVALVYEGGHSAKFFMNGRRLEAASKGGSRSGVSQPNVLQIGFRGSPVGAGKFGKFQGSMACVSVYERALTAAEIQEYMKTCP